MAERYKNFHDSQRKERQLTLCRDMWIRHLYRQSFPLRFSVWWSWSVSKFVTICCLDCSRKATEIWRRTIVIAVSIATCCLVIIAWQVVSHICIPPLPACSSQRNAETRKLLNSVHKGETQNVCFQGGDLKYFLSFSLAARCISPLGYFWSRGKVL